MNIKHNYKINYSKRLKASQGLSSKHCRGVVVFVLILYYKKNKLQMLINIKIDINKL